MPTGPLPPLTTMMKVWSAARLAFAHRVWTPRPLKCLLDALDGHVLERARGRCGQRLEPGRQRRLQQPGDVHVGIELIDQVLRGRVADRGVLEQLGALGFPLIRVEQQPVGPDREHPDDREQRCDPDQHIDEHEAPLGDLPGAGLGGRSRGCRLRRSADHGGIGVGLMHSAVGRCRVFADLAP